MPGQMQQLLQPPAEQDADAQLHFKTDLACSVVSAAVQGSASVQCCVLQQSGLTVGCGSACPPADRPFLLPQLLQSCVHGRPVGRRGVTVLLKSTQGTGAALQGIPTTRAGSVVTSDDRVTRDLLYTGNPIRVRALSVHAWVGPLHCLLQEAHAFPRQCCMSQLLKFLQASKAAAPI